MPPLTQTPSCTPDRLPDELKQLDQWVVWKLTPNDRDKDKLDKRPHTPRSGAVASHSNAATWGTYAEAVRAYESGNWNGIGFVLTRDDPYTIVDLDACFDDAGKPRPEAVTIAQTLASFTERSQSRKGLHIIIKGPSGAGSGRKSTLIPGIKSFEVYDHTRFFALTGDVVGKWTEVREAAPEVKALLARWTGQPGVQKTPLTDAEGAARLPVRNAHLSDQQMLALIAQEKEREYRWYFDGELPPTVPGSTRDGSKDDAGLLHVLIGYTGWDVERIERLCERSNIKREKWATKRKDSVTGATVTWLEYSILRALRSAAYALPDSDTTTSRMAAFHLLDDMELEDVADPEWLLDTVLPTGATTVLYGPSEGGKSFLALDWALSLAHGLSWHGLDVKRGPVLYVAAEGWAGFKRRVQAWKLAREMPGRAGVQFMSGMVNLLDPKDADRLLHSIETKIGGQQPVLIVLDTLFLSMPGGDENNPKDMGMAVSTAQSLRRLTGATVLLVHHVRRADGEERGHSSLRNAADVMLQLLKEDASDPDSARVLTCTKMKDAGYFEPIRFQLTKVGQSLVVADAAPAGEAGPGKPDKALSATRVLALKLLRHAVQPGEPGVTHTIWQKLCAPRHMDESTFDRAIRDLLGRQLIVNEGSDRSPKYKPVAWDDTTTAPALPF